MNADKEAIANTIRWHYYAFRKHLLDKKFQEKGIDLEVKRSLEYRLSKDEVEGLLNEGVEWANLEHRRGDKFNWPLAKLILNRERLERLPKPGIRLVFSNGSADIIDPSKLFMGIVGGVLKPRKVRDFKEGDYIATDFGTTGDDSIPSVAVVQRIQQDNSGKLFVAMMRPRTIT